MTRSRLFRACTTIVVLLLLGGVHLRPTTADPAAAATRSIVANGSFERGIALTGWGAELPVGSTAITGWKASGGPIDYIATYWQAANGKRSIDLNQQSRGGIEQTLHIAKGHVYRVTFRIAGNPDAGPTIKKLRVTVPGTARTFAFDVTGATREKMKWAVRRFDFTAQGDRALLRFRSLVDGSAGPALDFVTVVELAPAP